MRAAMGVGALLIAAAAARGQSCSITAVSGVSFGSYDALDTSPLDQTGSVTFDCDFFFDGFVTVDLSTGSSSTYFPREMRQGADSLQYNLYRTAARVLVWGDGTGGTSRFGPAIPLLGIPNTLTIFGRIPPQQASPVGAYADTVTATINF